MTGGPPLVPPDAAHRRGFRYPGVTVGVASPDASHLAWLEEFLTPAFALSAPDGCDRWVVLDTDAARHAAMLARGPRADRPPVACFVLDRGPVCHPEWNGAVPGARVLFDPAYRAFYRIDGRRGHVGILAPPDASPARAALMRVVRELAMAAALRRGGLLLHAAAFAVGERGVVLAGPKRAGKTTLLLHALEAAGTTFLANDRVGVRVEGGAVTLRGMPTIVSVRPDTLAAFPAVAARIRAGVYHHSRTLAESGPAGRRRSALRADGAASLTPAQLCEATKAAPRAEARAWRLVFPRVSQALTGIRLERLDAGTAGQRLVTALFGAPSPGRVSEALAPPADRAGVDEATLRRRAAGLATRVPCYDAHLGVDAYGGPEAADRLVAELTGPP